MNRDTEYTYVLRTCGPDMRSEHLAARGFLWPTSGPVECDDWDPSPQCGGGLHGLAQGEGNSWLLSEDPKAKWLVVKVRTVEIVGLLGKCKFPRGEVVYCGDRVGAVCKVQDEHPGAAVVYGTATAGCRGTATAGDWGNATASYGGTAMAGDYGTAMAGDYGTATAGVYGTAKAGEGGILQIQWWDGERCRLAVAYVGEDGIKANTPYRLDEHGNFVEVKA